MNRSTFALLLSLGILAHAPAAPVPVEKPTAKQHAEFEKLWNGIGWYQPDAVKFWCRVHANPKAGYAFLDRKIEPIQLSEAAAKRWIDDLGSDDEKTWKSAEARLIVRDVRLAMNFLDAWDYAKTNLQRQRLSSVTFSLCEHPQYYDATLEKSAVPIGRPPAWNLQLTLKKDVPQDLATHLGLTGGCGTCLSLEEMIAPSPYKSKTEQTVAAYLLQARQVAGKHLLERLSAGNPDEATTKIAKLGVRALQTRKLRALGKSIATAELPEQWDAWCVNSSEKDSFTLKLLECPDLAIPFLRLKLKPISADPLRIGLLLRLLAHPSDAVWECAAAAMHRADPRLCLSVEEIWKLAQTRDQRQRLAALLCPGIQSGKHFDYSIGRYEHGRQNIAMMNYWVRKDLPVESIPLDFQNCHNSSWGHSFPESPAEISRRKWFREEAAIWVLEAIGTDEAFGIVKRMATGHQEAGPTIAAKEVLARRYPK